MRNTRHERDRSETQILLWVSMRETATPILRFLVSATAVIATSSVFRAETATARKYDPLADSPFAVPYNGDCDPALCDQKSTVLDPRGYVSETSALRGEHRHFVTFRGGTPNSVVAGRNLIADSWKLGTATPPQSDYFPPSATGSN